MGYKKLVWGTDAPSVLCHDTYKELWQYLTEGKLFTEQELEAVLYGNALEAYPFHQ